MKPQKNFVLLTILILSLSAMLMAIPSGVLAANPATPEFSVAYVDHSYDVPVTHWTTTDPYTGEQIIHSSGGEHVDNRTIDITISNQPFTPYKDASNNTVYLYYDIRSKGHFENWNGDSDLGSHSQSGIQATTSAYTVVSLNIQYWSVPQGGQIDFQVKAITGYTVYNSQSCGTEYQTRVGDSGWSTTKTVTIGTPTQANTPQPFWTPNPTYPPSYPTSTPMPQENPTATPTQPNILTGVFSGSNWEQTTIIVMAVVIACFVIVVVALLRKVTSKEACIDRR